MTEFPPLNLEIARYKYAMAGGNAMARDGRRVLVIRGGKRQWTRVILRTRPLFVTVRPGYGGREAIRSFLEALRRLGRRLAPKLTKDGKRLVPLMEWTISEMMGQGFAAFARPTRRKWQAGEPARFIIDPAAIVEVCRSDDEVQPFMELAIAHEMCHAAEFALGLPSRERRSQEFARRWMSEGNAWRFWED